jgi:hypothetical protein
MTSGIHYYESQSLFLGPVAGKFCAVGGNGRCYAQMGVNLNYPTGRPDTLMYILRDDDSWKDATVSGNWFPDAFMGTMGSLQAYVEGSSSVLPTSVEEAIDTMRTVEAAYISNNSGGIKPSGI